VGGLFTGNRARYGGAIYNRARLNVTGSTFSGNSATESGGAVFSQTGNFNARDNGWGAAAGPTSALVNDKVLFAPFLTAGCPN